MFIVYHIWVELPTPQKPLGIHLGFRYNTFAASRTFYNRIEEDMHRRLSILVALVAALLLAAPAVATVKKLHIPHPPGTILYSLPRIPNPHPSGHLKLEFSSEFSAETIQRTETEVLPYLEEEFGRPWQNVDVSLYGPSHRPAFGDGGTTYTTCKNKAVAHDEIHLLLTNDLGLIAAELQHTLHGCFVFPDKRFEESLTEAAKTAVSQHFGLTQSECEPSECNDLRLPGSDNPALAGGFRFIEDTSNPLGDVRQRLGGMAFLQYEQGDRGFFARFNARMCEVTYNIQQHQGGHVHEYVTSAGVHYVTENANAIATASRVSGNFYDWFKQQTVFGPRPRGDALIIAPRQGEVEFITVHRVGEDETPLPGVPITLTIQGPSWSFSTTATSNPEGALHAHLPESARGYLKITATAPGGLHDEYAYYNIYRGS